MVVVHRQHCVKFPWVRSCITSTHEHGIGRKRPAGIDALRLCSGNRRGNDLDFLTPEDTALACVRVQASHRNARGTAQAFAQRLMRDAQGLQNLRLGHGSNRITQRHMDADQHGAQLVIGQHHAHRHLRDGDAGMSGCFGLQQLGMTREADTRQVQGFLVQRCGDQRRNFLAQRRLCSPDHTLGCSVPRSG